VGTGLVLAFALRQPRPSWPAVTLTLAGNVLLGFAIACVARRRTGEPGPLAAAAVVAILIVPGLLPVARWVHTFPAAAPDPHGLPATVLWWVMGGVCAVAVGVSLTSWPLPRWWRRPARSG
jgi:drug/metabolite transporter (DMT)-like permease